MPSQFTFDKSERLKSKLLIGGLFDTNEQVYNYPIKTLFTTTAVPQEAPVQIAVSVPKRNFKRAVDRNQLKRRIIEAYRLNKSILETPFQWQDKSLILIFIYVSNQKEPFQSIQNSVVETLKKINNTYTS